MHWRECPHGSLSSTVLIRVVVTLRYVTLRYVTLRFGPPRRTLRPSAVPWPSRLHTTHQQPCAVVCRLRERVCLTAGVCAHDCGYDGFAARVYPWLCVLILKKTCTLLHPHPHPGSTQISKTCVDDDEARLAHSHKLRRDWKSWMRWKLAASLTERGAVDRAAPVITQRAAGGQRTRCSRDCAMAQSPTPLCTSETLNSRPSASPGSHQVDSAPARSTS